MNILDSSGWLEYFADGPNAEHFSIPLENLDELLVPTICLYEVFKVVLRESGEDNALQATALMKQAKVIDITQDIAIMAAKISHEQQLPMADSLILSTAYRHEAVVWTQDIDLKGKLSVKFFPK
ncbi:putative nucleic acid-binding protein, contains PIN domain [Candidatus Electrothrix marina]|uniref:Putative nucleic acid-binding protein, contains PIN domain n=1 Tax=Candidatus Electrothrix marina TaxID=1859130 RepID=A0A444JCZ7_9BACT|nr:putative nucleic acid-binding protein, contains PIN domain [Candidatus Electrothrix marina]